MNNPAARWYTETRFTADTTAAGSRWERTGPSVDETTGRAQYLKLGSRPGVDVRLVRLDWDPEGDEDSMPITTVVIESTGAA